MATAALRALCFGIRFNPTPEEAIGLYLRRRVVGKGLLDTAGVIHEANLYKFEPKDLAAAYPRLPKTHNRFFFTTCKRKKPDNGNRMWRTAGRGNWVGSGKKYVKNSAGETIGSYETLKYRYKDKGRKAEWLMEEYRCCGLDRFAVDVYGNERVLCKLYVSPNSNEGSVTFQESAAGDLRLLGVQEPASTMAAAAEQQTTMALQQQQPPPRRQEPLLPAITQPQPIMKQVPKRPAPQVIEPPRSQRRRPTLQPLKVPPRHDIVTSNTPTRSSRCPPPLMTQPQQQASRPSPRATPRRCPRISPRSRPVAPPPPPVADEAPNDDMDELVRLLEAHIEQDNGIIQEEAGNNDKLAPEPEMAPQENQAMIQEETGNAARLSGSQLPPEEDHVVTGEEAINEDDWLMRIWETAEVEEVPEVTERGGKMQEEVPAVTEHGGKMQEEKEGQHQEHATSSLELEGLVADERGDDVAAQDLWDALNDDMDNPIDGTDWASLPLSAYKDIQF